MGNSEAAPLFNSVPVIRFRVPVHTPNNQLENDMLTDLEKARAKSAAHAAKIEARTQHLKDCAKRSQERVKKAAAEGIAPLTDDDNGEES